MTTRNESDYYAPDWMGFDWSSWLSLDPADGEFSRVSTNPGIYRVRHLDRDGLTYIGQSGNLKSRLYKHRRNRDEELLFSYAIVDDGDAKHKREQIETDLIGAHWLANTKAPRDQF